MIPSKPQGVLGEADRLRQEIVESLGRMQVPDLWKVHKEVNAIQYAANLARYERRGAATEGANG